MRIIKLDTTNNNKKSLYQNSDFLDKFSTNSDCIAFGRDAVYVYMKFPAGADLCFFFTRSEDLFVPENVSARCVS